MEGTILWFDPARRHGFMRMDEGERLRVDQGGFAAGEALGDRCRGTWASFESPRSVLKRAREQTLRERREVKLAKKDARVAERRRAAGPSFWPAGADAREDVG